MKKGYRIVFIILSIIMIIGGVEFLVFAAVYNPTAPEVPNTADIDLYDIEQYTTVYFDKIDVLERYAFKTMHEYKDSEGSYTDTTYYVYDASQPMDKNELISEYYIVKISDKNGGEYITSLSIDTSKDIYTTVKNAPIQISACVGASPAPLNDLSPDTTEGQLKILRETSLKEYSEKSQIPTAPVILAYKTETSEQALNNVEKETVETKIIAVIGGLVLMLAGIGLLILTKNKK